MSTIYLIRHGQASFGQDNYDQLSEVGIEQAKVLGTSFAQRDIRPDHIIRGDMFRHQQTQDNCLEQLTLSSSSQIRHTLHIDENWNEFPHQEVLAVYDERFAIPSKMMEHFKHEANPQATFIHTFNQALNRWKSGEYDNEYSEPWSTFKRRVMTGLDAIATQTGKGQSSLVFTSGGAIAVVVMAMLDVADEHFMKINMNIANCGVTQLKVTKQGLMLQVMNDHSLFDLVENKALLTFR